MGRLNFSEVMWDTQLPISHYGFKDDIKLDMHISLRNL